MLGEKSYNQSQIQYYDNVNWMVKRSLNFYFILRFKMYFLPSLQTQTASWFWISHFPLLQPVHVKLLHSVEVWKNWNTFLAFFSYYLNIGLKNNALDKGQSIMQTTILSSKIWKTIYFHFVIKVKCGNNKENNIKAWHPIKNRF